MASGAPRRCQDRPVVCGNDPWCTREVVSEVRRVRRGGVLHTRGGRERHLCAKMGAGAYESERDVTAVNKNGLWCTQEKSGGECWVRRRVQAHTGGGTMRLLYAESAPNAHEKPRDEAVVIIRGPDVMAGKDRPKAVPGRSQLLSATMTGSGMLKRPLPLHTRVSASERGTKRPVGKVARQRLRGGRRESGC